MIRLLALRNAQACLLGITAFICSNAAVAACSWPEQMVTRSPDLKCRQEIIAHFTDPQDRIEITRFFKNWRPQPGTTLTVDDGTGSLSVNGHVVFDWMILSAERGYAIVNGQFTAADMSDSSIFRRTRKALAQRKNAQSPQRPLQILLAEKNAFAFGFDFSRPGEPGQTELGVGLFVIALAQNRAESGQRQDMSERDRAAQSAALIERQKREAIERPRAEADRRLAAERLREFRDSLPQPDSGFWFSGSPITCRAQGASIVEATATFDDKKLVFKPTGDGKQIEIMGLSDQPIRIQVDAHIPTGDKPCENVWSSDMKLSCDAAWKEVLQTYKADADRHKENGGSLSIPRCSYLGASAAACEKFMRDRFKDQMGPATARKPLVLASCGDKNCATAKSIEPSELAKTFSKRGATPEQTGKRLQDFLQKKALGIVGLGRCCGNEACRQNFNEVNPGGLKLERGGPAAGGSTVQ